KKVPASQVAVIGLAILALLAWLVTVFRRLPLIGLVLAVMSLSLLFGSYQALSRQLLLPVLTVIVFAWIYYIVTALMEYVSERRARGRAVAAFGRFLDPRVVQSLVESGE